MAIDPLGPPTNFPAPSNADQAPKSASFNEDSPGVAGETRGKDGVFADVLSQFRRADLQDPSKVEDMLSQCTNNLVASTLSQSNQKLSPEESSYLADWLKDDVSVRNKLLTYLGQTLPAGLAEE